MQTESIFRQLRKLKLKHKLCNKPLIWVCKLWTLKFKTEELRMPDRQLCHHLHPHQMMVMKKLLKR